MTTPNPRVLLERDHEHLDKLLRVVAASIREDALEDAKARWNELESALLAHLDAEEMFVIPLLRAASEVEARKILDEHETIRQTLGDVGIAFDLHTVRADAIDAFCTYLREHAAHEEKLMYSKIAAELPHSNARAILSRLRGHAAH